MVEVDEIVTVSNGFFAKGKLEEQPIVGSGSTADEATADFFRVLAIIERSQERWETLAEREVPVS